MLWLKNIGNTSLHLPYWHSFLQRGYRLQLIHTRRYRLHFSTPLQILGLCETIKLGLPPYALWPENALRHQQSKMSSFLLCHNMWIFESTIRQPKTCDSYKDTDSTFQLLSKSLVCVKLSNLDYPLMPYGPKTRLTAPTIQNAIMPSSPQNVWFAQPLA